MFPRQDIGNFVTNHGPTSLSGVDFTISEDHRGSSRKAVVAWASLDAVEYGLKVSVDGGGVLTVLEWAEIHCSSRPI